MVEEETWQERREEAEERLAVALVEMEGFECRAVVAEERAAEAEQVARAERRRAAAVEAEATTNSRSELAAISK